MRIRIDEKISFTDAYIFLYLLIYFVHYFGNFSFNITYSFWIMTGLAGLFTVFDRRSEYSNYTIRLLFIDLFAAIGLIVNRNRSPFTVLMLPVSQMFGIYLYKYRENLRLVNRIVNLMYVYIVLYAIFIPPRLVSASQGIYSTRFSRLVGGNTVSIFLIMFLSIGLIYKTYSGRKNYFMFIISLLVAYRCGGNGGVLSISVFLIGLITLQWDKNKMSKKRILFIVIAGYGLICYFGYQQKLWNFLTDDNSRFWIWSKYLECMTNSAKDFLFGASVDRYSFLAEQRNMHNTFFNLHYYYGIIPALYYIVMIISLLMLSIKKGNYLLLVILGVTVIRGMTDETAFCFISLWTYACLLLKSNEISIFRRNMISE